MQGTVYGKLGIAFCTTGENKMRECWKGQNRVKNRLEGDLHILEQTLKPREAGCEEPRSVSELQP